MTIPAIVLALAGCSGSGGSPVVGQWGGQTANAPALDFKDAGTFSGNDGCNSLTGTWYQQGTDIKLSPLAMTMMACPGPVSLLSTATVARVKGDTMLLFNQNDRPIGGLPRTGTGK